MPVLTSSAVAVVFESAERRIDVSEGEAVFVDRDVAVGATSISGMELLVRHIDREGRRAGVAVAVLDRVGEGFDRIRVTISAGAV